MREAVCLLIDCHLDSKLMKRVGCLVMFVDDGWFGLCS